MKISIRMAFLVFGLSLIAAPLSGASETKHGTEMTAGEQAMEQPGNIIHKSEIDGYQLSYELIDMREKMPDMPEMAATHHLMVYVKGPDGKASENAKAGFLIEKPDGQVQKAMCMGMGGGYGADVNLERNGTYIVKTKIVIGKDKLLDSFSHEIGD